MNNLVLVCSYLKRAVQISRNNKGHRVSAHYIFQKKKQKSSVSLYQIFFVCVIFARWCVAISNMVFFLCPHSWSFHLLALPGRITHFNHWMPAKPVKNRNYNLLEKCAKYEDIPSSCFLCQHFHNFQHFGISLCY